MFIFIFEMSQNITSENDSKKKYTRNTENRNFDDSRIDIYPDSVYQKYFLTRRNKVLGRDMCAYRARRQGYSG